MDEGSNGSTGRLILFTERALADLANIDNATAAMWGEAQAERYLGFLSETLYNLVQSPTIGRAVEQRPGVMVLPPSTRNEARPTPIAFSIARHLPASRSFAFCTRPCIGRTIWLKTFSAIPVSLALA